MKITEEYTDQEIIKVMKFARNHMQLDMLHMATKMNVPYNTYCRWERGVMTVRHKTILVKCLQKLVQEYDDAYLSGSSSSEECGISQDGKSSVSGGSPSETDTGGSQDNLPNEENPADSGDDPSRIC